MIFSSSREASSVTRYSSSIRDFLRVAMFGEFSSPPNSSETFVRDCLKYVVRKLQTATHHCYLLQRQASRSVFQYCQSSRLAEKIIYKGNSEKKAKIVYGIGEAEVKIAAGSSTLDDLTLRGSCDRDHPATS